MVVLIKSLLIMAGSGVDGMESAGHDSGSGTKGRRAGECLENIRQRRKDSSPPITMSRYSPPSVLFQLTDSFSESGNKAGQWLLPFTRIFCYLFGPFFGRHSTGGVIMKGSRRSVCNNRLLVLLHLQLAVSGSGHHLRCVITLLHNTTPTQGP